MGQLGPIENFKWDSPTTHATFALDPIQSIAWDSSGRHQSCLNATYICNTEVVKFNSEAL